MTGSKRTRSILVRELRFASGGYCSLSARVVNDPLIILGRADLSNPCGDSQILFDLYLGEGDDFALERPCDKARFFGLLKQAGDPVTIGFIQDGDDGPKCDLRKAPDAILIAEHAFGIQVERDKFKAGLRRKARESADEATRNGSSEKMLRGPATRLS